MAEEYSIHYVEDPEESAWGIIGRGVRDHNTRQAGDDDFQRLCFVLVSSDQEVVGGVLAEAYWGWLHIDLLWIKEELRGRAYGRTLLAKVEEEGRKRGAKNAFLDTFSFQAPEFYRKCGYRVFGELPDFPEGHRRFFLVKRL